MPWALGKGSPNAEAGTACSRRGATWRCEQPTGGKKTRRPLGFWRVPWRSPGLPPAPPEASSGSRR
eukprot:8989746-Pyramimonas_sp.AAC.1